MNRTPDKKCSGRWMFRLIFKYVRGGANIPSGTRKYVALDSAMEITITGLNAA
jgi:hypothetical protein